MNGTLGVVLLAVVLLPASAAAGSASPSPEPSPVPLVGCPVTTGIPVTPPGEDAEVLAHGDGRLFVGLPPAGVLDVDPRFVEPDGSISLKLPWWRATGVGEAGDLTITGHELASGRAIRAEIPDGYGQRFQATGIFFPVEGCYEITGRSGDAALTFIVDVRTSCATIDPDPSPAPGA
jgi:hypothetical protein